MKKFKLAKILAPSLMVLPLTTMTIAGCSKGIQKTIADDLINEFIQLCQYSRPTYHTKTFCEYVANRAKDLSEDPIIVYDDRETYTPTEKYDDNGYNMYYDIPSNLPEGTTNEPPMIIIQCHTDMVWVVKDGYADFVTHPEPVKDRIQDPETGEWINVIHTDNYLSSLGADNGIGVAACLSLTKHAKDFYHGPIRFMFTADEEDGDSGAIDVPEKWFKSDAEGIFDIGYLLNIDLEQIYNMGISCGGVQQAKFSHQFDLFTLEEDEEYAKQHEGVRLISPYYYSLKINGLRGGHSAQVINENRLNSIVLAAELIRRFGKFEQPAPYGGLGFQLQSISELDDPKPKPNRVCDSITMTFATTLDPERAWSLVGGSIQNIIQNEYPDEKSVTFELKTIIGAGEQEPGVLTHEDTQKIPDLILGTSLSDKGLHQGVWSWYDDQHQVVETSNNIGSIRLHDGMISPSGKEKNGLLYLETFGRSSNIDHLGPKEQKYEWEGFMDKYSKASVKVFGPGAENQWDNYSWNAPWPRKPDDLLQQVIVDAAEHFNYEMNPSDRIGWLELAAFAEKTDNKINMVSIGPTVPNVHTCEEVVYTDTIEPLVNMILYTLQHLRKE